MGHHLGAHDRRERDGHDAGDYDRRGEREGELAEEHAGEADRETRRVGRQWSPDSIAKQYKSLRKLQDQEVAESTELSPSQERRYRKLRARYWEARQKYANYLARHDPGLWRLLLPCDPELHQRRLPLARSTSKRMPT